MTNLKKTLIAIIFASTTMSAYAQTKKEPADAKKQLQEILKSNKQIEENLKKFDTLDFVVYSTQDWKRLHESHAKNIKVHYPDGSVTIGLDDHIKQLSPMFTFSPNTKIKEQRTLNNNNNVKNNNVKNILIKSHKKSFNSLLKEDRQPILTK